MKKLFTLSLCFTLFCLCLGGPARASSPPEIVVEDIHVDVLDYAGTDYAWFIVSCTVTNPTGKSGTASVAVRTIDQWAYDRKELRLSGQVEAGEKVTLTALNFMDYKLFQNLRKYQVKSAEIH